MKRLLTEKTSKIGVKVTMNPDSHFSSQGLGTEYGIITKRFGGSLYNVRVAWYNKENKMLNDKFLYRYQDLHLYEENNQLEFEF